MYDQKQNLEKNLFMRTLKNILSKIQLSNSIFDQKGN